MIKINVSEKCVDRLLDIIADDISLDKEKGESYLGLCYVLHELAESRFSGGEQNA